MFLQINDKKYEIATEEVLSLVYDIIEGKTDAALEELGPMSGMFRSMINSFLASKGIKKNEHLQHLSLIEIAILTFLEKHLEELTGQTIPLQLKEVVEEVVDAIVDPTPTEEVAPEVVAADAPTQN